jgi:hypothetical protein
MRKHLLKFRNYVAAGAKKPPPMLVPQGVSTVLGWLVYIFLARVAGVGGATLGWIMFAVSLGIFILVGVVADRFRPQVRWAVGFLGWIVGMVIVWIYQLSFIR